MLHFPTFKDLADHNFQFDENSQKLSKKVENTVGGQEKLLIMSYSPFPMVFSKDLYCRHIKKRVCLRETLKVAF